MRSEDRAALKLLNWWRCQQKIPEICRYYGGCVWGRQRIWEVVNCRIWFPETQRILICFLKREGQKNSVLRYFTVWGGNVALLYQRLFEVPWTSCMSLTSFTMCLQAITNKHAQIEVIFKSDHCLRTYSATGNISSKAVRETSQKFEASNL